MFDTPLETICCAAAFYLGLLLMVYLEQILERLGSGGSDE